jgi:hypothetical protein
MPWRHMGWEEVQLLKSKKKKKSKAARLHAMEEHGGRGGIAPTRT